MDRSDLLKVAKKPSDLEGTPLERRSFMKMLQVGGALTLGPSLAGCTGDGNNSGTGTQGGSGTGTGSSSVSAPEELVIARPSDADLLDPHRTQLSASSQVMSLIYDGMILMDADRNFHPMLGNGFEISDDGTEWTIEFNVDSGIKFHNGDDFTVDDVVFTFERFMEKSFLRSWAAGSLQGVEKVDNKSVKFSFKQPYAFFQSHTSANSYFGIIPENLGGKSAEEFGQNPIGTGPYKLDEWVKGERITLVRNDDWTTPTYEIIEAEDPPLPRKITWQVIPSATPRVQGLLTGDIDALTNVPARKRKQVQDSDSANLHSEIGGTIYYVPLHNGLAPTNDINVRKAIAHAIDKKRIVQDIFYGAGKVNHSPMPAGFPAWAGPAVKDQVGYAYDPEKAKQILADAGWEQGSGDYRQKDGTPLELEMIAPNAPPAMLQSSEEVAAMLGNVGINVNLRTMGPNASIVEMQKGNAHATFSGIGWFTADIMQFMLSSGLAGASNLQFLKDDEVDQYLAQAGKTLNEEERAQIYQDLQLRVMELCATVPIMTPAEENAIRSEFTGYHNVGGAAGAIWLDVGLKNE